LYIVVVPGENEAVDVQRSYLSCTQITLWYTHMPGFKNPGFWEKPNPVFLDFCGGNRGYCGFLDKHCQLLSDRYWAGKWFKVL